MNTSPYFYLVHQYEITFNLRFSYYELFLFRLMHNIYVFFLYRVTYIILFCIIPRPTVLIISHHLLIFYYTLFTWVDIFFSYFSVQSFFLFLSNTAQSLLHRQSQHLKVTKGEAVISIWLQFEMASVNGSRCSAPISNPRGPVILPRFSSKQIPYQL